MKNAAVGFRPHSGWSALVVLCVEGRKPVVLSRERIHLVKTFNYSFRQPYHTAEKMGLPEGRKFISQMRAEARGMAYRALRGVQAKLEETDYRLSDCGLLLASGRALPDLEKILAAHPLIHTAEGELFREALSFASRKYGLREFQVRERELVGRAARSFGLTEAGVLKRVTELGRPLGVPWSQDEKYAALAAWLALSDGGNHSAARRIRAGKGG